MVSMDFRTYWTNPFGSRFSKDSMALSVDLGSQGPRHHFQPDQTSVQHVPYARNYLQMSKHPRNLQAGWNPTKENEGLREAPSIMDLTCARTYLFRKQIAIQLHTFIHWIYRSCPGPWDNVTSVSRQQEWSNGIYICYRVHLPHRHIRWSIYPALEERPNKSTVSVVLKLLWRPLL